MSCAEIEEISKSDGASCRDPVAIVPAVWRKTVLESGSESYVGRSIGLSAGKIARMQRGKTGRYQPKCIANVETLGALQDVELSVEF